MPFFDGLKPLLKTWEGSISRIIIASSNYFMVGRRITIVERRAVGQPRFRWVGIVKEISETSTLVKLRLKCKKGYKRPRSLGEIDFADQRLFTDEDVLEVVVTVTEPGPNPNPVEEILIVSVTQEPEEPDFPDDPDGL